MACKGDAVAARTPRHVQKESAFTCRTPVLWCTLSRPLNKNRCPCWCRRRRSAWLGVQRQDGGTRKHSPPVPFQSHWDPLRAAPFGVSQEKMSLGTGFLEKQPGAPGPARPLGRLSSFPTVSTPVRPPAQTTVARAAINMSFPFPVITI